MEEIVERVVQGKDGEGRGRIEVWKCGLGDHDRLLGFAKKVNGVMLNVVFLVSPTNTDAIPGKRCCKSKSCLPLYLVCSSCPTSRASRREGERLPVLESVSSGGHELVMNPGEKSKAGNLLRTYNDPVSFNPRTQYQTSKLFVMHAWYADACRDKEVRGGKPEVLALAVCPGDAKSNLSWSHQGVGAEVFKWVLASMFLRTTEQRARTLVSGLLLGEGP